MAILHSGVAMSLRRLTIRGLTTFAIPAAPVLCLGQAVITTVVGSGVCCGLTVDRAGNLYVWETASRIRKVTPAGVSSTVAGNGQPGYTGDGGPATSARLFANGSVYGLAVDSAGNLYISDGENNVIRKVNPAGIISTVAGKGAPGFSGDGGAATSALLDVPAGIALDSAGNLYIAEFSFTIGGAALASQTVSVSSSGAPLTFAISTSGGAWLAVVGPPSATTPATLNVSVTPTGLAAGTYQGVITLTPIGAVNTPQNFGVTLTVSGAGAPVFSGSGVVNASGYQTKLAPGVLFSISGRGLGPASAATASAPSYPISLGGASVTFTPAAGGPAVEALIVSAVDAQVTGLLPSTVSPGVYAVRATYNGQTSAPQNATIVARSFGITTTNNAGSGPAQATVSNADGGASLVRFTSGSLDFNGANWTTAPAHPGDSVDLSGTGGGADPAGDAGGSSGDQTADGNFIMTVGDRQITPLYAGTVAGSPDVWRISFILPTDIPPDCFAAVQVSAGGELSNVVSIPIAAAGESACSDPQSSPSVLTKLDAGEDIIVAAFGIAKIRATAAGVTQESASGFVARYTAAEWILTRSGPKVDLCTVYDRTYPRGGRDPATPDGFLGAGIRLPLGGPNLSPAFAMGSLATPNGPVYTNSPAAGTFAGGAYSLTGLGGTQVGAFSASTLVPAGFTVTNWDAVTAIDRTRPLTFNWTGSGFDQVFILANTATTVGSNQHIVTISCYVPAGPGAYSVSPAALAYLQPAATTGASVGGVSVQAVSAPGTFTAPLARGSQTDLGVFGANLGVEKNIAIQ